VPLSRLLGRILGILHGERWSGGHCGHLRVGPFNFASLLPVRGMLDLHRFQVDETKEIGFDRNREAVDVEVFYSGLCRSGRTDHRVYTVRDALLHHAAQDGFGPRAGAPVHTTAPAYGLLQRPRVTCPGLRFGSIPSSITLRTQIPA